MGGLLIADAARNIFHNTHPGNPLWPHVIAIMAFDTPYLGLHPHTFKHSLSTAAGYVEQARNIASAAGMLSPLAIGVGAGKWGWGSGSTEQAGSSGTASTSRTASPTNAAKGKSPVTTPESEIPTSTSTGKSWWPVPTVKTLYGLGAVALGAAAMGTAYYRREDFLNGWKWGYEHMTFVRNLWDEEGMKGRLDDIDVMGREKNIRFWK